VGDGFYEVGNDWHPYPGQHKAQDLDGGDEGTPVYAVANGSVIQAGPSSISSLGNTVQIDHGGGIISLYAHLASVGVGVGQTMSGGHTIVGGMGGSGGWVPHLHLEIWTNSSRDYRVDPLPRVGQGFAPTALSSAPVQNEGNRLMRVVVVNGIHFLVGARYICKSAGPAYDQTMQALYGSDVALNADQFNTVLTNHGIPWGVPASLGSGEAWFNGAKVVA
jgi:hypothetical protein